MNKRLMIGGLVATVLLPATALAQGITIDVGGDKKKKDDRKGGRDRKSDRERDKKRLEPTIKIR